MSRARMISERNALLDIAAKYERSAHTYPAGSGQHQIRLKAAERNFSEALRIEGELQCSN